MSRVLIEQGWPQVVAMITVSRSDRSDTLSFGFCWRELSYAGAASGESFTVGKALTKVLAIFGRARHLLQTHPAKSRGTLAGTCLVRAYGHDDTSLRCMLCADRQAKLASCTLYL